MAKQEVDIGIEGNDNTGDSIRESFRKVNENFSELYAVFGIGGQISFTDLSDVPNTYIDQENKIPVVKENATGLNFLELASDSDADPNDVDDTNFAMPEPEKTTPGLFGQKTKPEKDLKEILPDFRDTGFDEDFYQ